MTERQIIRTADGLELLLNLAFADKQRHIVEGFDRVVDGKTAEQGAVGRRYERLLLEVMRGNQNLFVRKDEIEAAWKWCDQLIAGWKKSGDAPKP
ncbi:hypothetical protein Q6291_29530, partial [Klebsiella pneumoniae]